jgi:lipid-A-disaccharide synthase
MGKNEKNILVISGGECGNRYGALLIEALKRLMPSIAIKEIPYTSKVFRELKGILDKERVDCVVFVEFPFFKLRFAKEAKRRGIPVVCYLSSQIWRGMMRKVKKISCLIDKMLVAFLFQVPLYKDAGVDVEFVGHPLIDHVSCPMTKDEAKAALGYHRTEVIVTLLPGSDTEEVKNLLGTMVEGAVEAAEVSRWKVRLVLPASEKIDETLLSSVLKDINPAEIKVLREEMFTALRASDAAIVASGEATLETAIIGTPMLVIRKLSPFSYVLNRLLVGVNFIGFPNIISGKQLVPELTQGKITPQNIAVELSGLLEGGTTTDEILSKIKEELGPPGATGRAAEAIRKIISN